MYKFQYKQVLTDDEYAEYFDFMKSFLFELYGEDALTNESFVSWKNNQKKLQNIIYVKLMKNNVCCGYADLIKVDETTLHFCNVIVKESERRTLIVFKFLQDLISKEELKQYQNITLHINRNNNNSYNAWSRFNYELIEQGKNSNKYKIKRENVEKYFKRFNKNMNKSF